MWCENGVGTGQTLYGLGLALKINARSCVVPSGAGWESMLGSCLRLGLVQSELCKADLCASIPPPGTDRRAKLSNKAPLARSLVVLECQPRGPRARAVCHKELNEGAGGAECDARIFEASIRFRAISRRVL